MASKTALENIHKILIIRLETLYTYIGVLRIISAVRRTSNAAVIRNATISNRATFSVCVFSLRFDGMVKVKLDWGWVEDTRMSVRRA